MLVLVVDLVLDFHPTYFEDEDELKVHEIRNPKAEIRKKAEGRIPKRAA